MSGLCRAHGGSMLGPCWLYVGACWAHFGPCLAYVAPMFACIGHVGPMLGPVGPMLGLCWAMLSPNLATYPILGLFKTLGKTQDSRAIKAPPS